MSAPPLAPGFADPVHGAQTAFRSILNAMAHPGRIERLTGVDVPPDGLEPAAAIVAMTLADADTSVWLSPALQGQTKDWMTFHCGSRLVSEAAPRADFAFVSRRDPRPRLNDCLLEDPKYPERSTTMVLACEALDGGPQLTLSGPGVNRTATFAPKGVDPKLWEERAALRELYPLGVDLILVAGHAIAALPRTTVVLQES